MYNLATLRSIMSQSSTYFIFKLDIFEWVIFSQFFFFATPCGIWDLSFPTRGQAHTPYHTPYSDSAES